MIEVSLSIPLNKMNIVDFIYRQAKVKSVEYQEKNVKLDAIINKNILSNLLKNNEIELVD